MPKSEFVGYHFGICSIKIDAELCMLKISDQKSAIRKYGDEFLRIFLWQLWHHEVQSLILITTRIIIKLRKKISGKLKLWIRISSLFFTKTNSSVATLIQTKWTLPKAGIKTKKMGVTSRYGISITNVTWLESEWK